jgi:hypothetical protein
MYLHIYNKRHVLTRDVPETVLDSLDKKGEEDSIFYFKKKRCLFLSSEPGSV